MVMAFFISLSSHQIARKGWQPDQISKYQLQFATTAESFASQYPRVKLPVLNTILQNPDFLNAKH